MSHVPEGTALVAAVALLIVGVAVAALILRRSLIGAAVAAGMMGQALAWGAAATGREEMAVVLVAMTLVIATALAGAAIAVHRRRGIDHVDELRELQG